MRAPLAQRRDARLHHRPRADGDAQRRRRSPRSCGEGRTAHTGAHACARRPPAARDTGTKTKFAVGAEGREAKRASAALESLAAFASRSRRARAPSRDRWFGARRAPRAPRAAFTLYGPRALLDRAAIVDAAADAVADAQAREPERLRQRARHDEPIGCRGASASDSGVRELDVRLVDDDQSRRMVDDALDLRAREREASRIVRRAEIGDARTCRRAARRCRESDSASARRRRRARSSAPRCRIIANVGSGNAIPSPGSANARIAESSTSSEPQPTTTSLRRERPRSPRARP